ncbi:MAG: transketolase, partial [Gammaproteobacteria bacterium]|nr:transketolase [Gammaproteobacteria bacterium]
MPRRTLANAIRALSMDAVQQAASGHPGAPMGMADIAEVLWNDVLVHNPANPTWFNRDRFVLSNGHGSMLMYSLLHLSGYAVSLEDIKRFRQMGSNTAGHPEYGLTPGVETTTGPLGQGLANAVGMALAERTLAARFNRDDLPLVDHYTYVAIGDGCLMEGISHEACSLAGTLSLGKLVALYDDNGISIDGRIDGWFRDDTPARFAAYDWHVVPDVDGHDAAAIAAALAAARAEPDRPSLICCKTVIGKGAPTKAGTAASHGAPLGEDEIAGARAALDWPHGAFEIPADIYAAWDAREAGAAAENDWQALLERYRIAYPAQAAEFERCIAGRLPDGWRERTDELIAAVEADGPRVATRKASEMALDAFGPLLPELIGGSADLTGSNNTRWSGAHAIDPDDADSRGGNYVYFGVREFAMTAMLNGMALHGGLTPYGGTFLVFSDYARNAVRMSALMGVHSILVYTHDSVGLGEDGPTHQPVEHAASLRLIPNLHVWRPCDATETMAAWRTALERRDGPSALLLTRQGLPSQPKPDGALAAIEHGAYVLVEPDRAPDGVVIATGSEVELARAAAAALAGEGVALRVVSMPCAEQFDAQPDAYRDAVLPPALTRRVAIEAGSTGGWYRYTGLDGLVIGIDSFGESAPAADVFAHFGLTAEAVT